MSAPENEDFDASSMVHRVAKAIREGRQCGNKGEPLTVPCPFCEWGPDKLTAQVCETGCIWLARAAILAIREPTEEMMEAGRGELKDVEALIQIAGYHGAKLTWKDGQPPLWHAYRAMNLAALDGGK